MIIDESDYLAHYGVLRKSGRYPWGSGGPETASNQGFLGMIDKLRADGMSDTEIARSLDITTTQLRAARSIASNEVKAANISMAQRLKDKGYSNVAIGERMGINESSVRSLLSAGAKDNANSLASAAEMLKQQVADKKFVDVGSGVEYQLDMSATKLSNAVAMLKEEGYEVHKVQVDQVAGDGKTTIKVLAPPGTTYRDIAMAKDQIQQIQQIQAYSDDGGRTFIGMQPPLQVSSKRIGINYAEDGGTAADGVIYVRPGVKDLDMGGNRYAQVRIAVDGTHYLKGMAVLKDDLPPGVDLVFNTNKSNKGDKLAAMKKISDDETNPFGSTVRQKIEFDGSGKPKVTSAMNIVNDDSDWDKWSKNLSTQVLSKQEPRLAQQQLDMTYERKKREFDEIMALTNPAVKRKLLQEFSDGTDASAVHLKAAALPRQKTHVILPVNSLKPNEVYAPNYRNGEVVALIRYPHGGKFEIPELVVNNNHAPAKELLGRAKTAIGINAKVAERLSGADFDGDTVLVIPNGNRQLKTQSALQGLKGFDPQRTYPAYEGMTPMTARTKGIEMGKVSNLITDMTIRGATDSELARAVRHSMVVIDGEKHNLNYKQSAKDNGINDLYAKYQGRAQGGASTLISRATSPTRIDEVRPRSMAKGGPIDKQTGRLMYEPTGRSYVNSKGKTIYKQTEVAKLANTRDANTLSSGTKVEQVYASHSNRLKALADQARLEMVNTKTTPYSPSAKAAYSKEVETLNSKLAIALRNRPRERQAQLVAQAAIAQRRAANPTMDQAQLKKVKSQELVKARIRTGANKEAIDITPNEWAAIQAGAISNHKLEQILANAKPDVVKELATPREQTLMTPTKTARAKSMAGSGYTQAEIADALGVSVSTLQSSLSS